MNRVAGRVLQAGAGQHFLGAGPSPLGGADQTGAHPARNAGEGHILIARLVVVAEVVDGQHQRVVDQAGDGQDPGRAVDERGFCFQEDFVMVFDGRVFRPRAGHGHDRVIGVGERRPAGLFGIVGHRISQSLL